MTQTQTKEPMFTLLKWEYFYGWTVYTLLLSGVVAISFWSVRLFGGVDYSGSGRSLQSLAQAEDRTDIAPRSVGVISAHEKEIIQSAIDYCRDDKRHPDKNHLTGKPLQNCIDMQSRMMGIK